MSEAPNPAGESSATSSIDWPRLPAPPRNLEHADELVALAGDGHGAFVWMIPFFFLGAILGVALLSILELPELLFLAGPLLGAWVGQRINRSLLLGVLRDGVETRCAVVRIIGGQKPSVIYSYTVDGEESRHDVTNLDAETLATLEVGTPVLVIHDRRRIGRHVAFVAPRFAAVRGLVGSVGQPAPPSSEPARATVDPPSFAAGSPYRDRPAPTGRQLPRAPRASSLATREALGLGLQTRHLWIVGVPALLDLALAVLVQQGILDASAPVVWVSALLLIGLPIHGFGGWWVLTRRLLRRGVETTARITAIEPYREHMRIGFEFSVGAETRTWVALADPEAVAVAVGDTVPALYLAGNGFPWLCVGFVTREAQELIERWR